MFSITDNSDEIARAMERVDTAASYAPRLFASISGIMHDEVEENFAQEGRPAWLGLKPPVSPKRRGGKILQASGQLVASITPGSSSNSAWVGTNKPYAAIQNNGGKTKPHKIVPRNKKALAFGGIVRRAVNHPGSVIPAREFMVISDAGENRILSETSKYLAAAAK